MIRIEFPLRTASGLNNREHWRTRARRVRLERLETLCALAIHLPHFVKRETYRPMDVLLTRFGPSNGLDSDNLQGSLKSVRDEIAKWLGVDDKRSDVVRYLYSQEHAKTWGVRVEFAPMLSGVSA